MSLSDTKTNTPDEWLLDSGASMHFTNDINDFVDYQIITPIKVVTANGSTQVKGKGAVILVINQKAVRIEAVYHIPDLTTKLISLGQLLQSELFTRGSARSISVEDGSENFLTFHPSEMNPNLYFIRALIYKEEALAKMVQCIYTIDFEVMHRRLANPSKEVLQKARKHVKEFPKISIPEGAHICPGCAQGKMTKKSFPPSESRETMPFALIHSDLKSFPIDSYHKFKYAIVFLDDATSHAWTMNLRSKDAAITATKQFLAMVRNKYKTTVGKGMSDAGGEYKSNAFIKMLKDEGIKILQSIPHTHQQNGRAERIIRTLMEKGESMRLKACFPQSWWEFSLEHAAHVYNRTPIRHLSWQTPHEQLNRKKPTVDHLRVFGCGAYVYIPAEVRSNKLAPKSELMTYLGNAPGGKGWQFMRVPNNIICTSAHAIFDETMFPKCPLAVRRPNTRVRTPAPEPSRAPCSDKQIGRAHV